VSKDGKANLHVLEKYVNMFCPSRSLK